MWTRCSWAGAMMVEMPTPRSRLRSGAGPGRHEGPVARPGTCPAPGAPGRCPCWSAPGFHESIAGEVVESETLGPERRAPEDKVIWVRMAMSSRPPDGCDQD